MDAPETRYAETEDGARIAYQAFGEGERVLVGIPGFAQNVELMWEQPTLARFLRRWGHICRAVVFDKRGTGLSDRRLPQASLEQRVQDLVAVMEAERIERATISGFSEGGALAAFFAATFPERTDGLLICGTPARITRSDDHPWAPTERMMMLRARLLASVWGTGLMTTRIFVPSMARQRGFRRWAARYERESITRSGILEYFRITCELDIRHLLPSIRVPTLVNHARGDRAVPLESGQYLAEHIPGARFVELDTDDHPPYFGAQDFHLELIEEFMAKPAPGRRSHDRVLSTVLFTDIVGSTELAGRVGDSEWSELLDRHDRLCRSEVELAGGRWVKSTGDGLLATFDAPSLAARTACALRERLRDDLGLEIRAGLHTGEIELRGDDIGGLAVHLASRVQGVAGPSEVIASSTVRDLAAGSGIEFSDRGAHELKGVSGTHRLFDVVAP